MNKSEDQVYIDLTKNGDTTAFAYLVDRYKDMAYTISLKMIRDPDEAEDAAQESFIRAYESIGSFRGNGKFSTWLYTIVYRTCLRYIKRNRTIQLNDEDEAWPADDQIPVIERLQNDEQSRYIANAINELPPIESLLITLYYMNESSIREIGEITGLSAANIKIQLFRARKRLEKKLSCLIIKPAK